MIIIMKSMEEVKVLIFTCGVELFSHENCWRKFLLLFIKDKLWVSYKKKSVMWKMCNF